MRKIILMLGIVSLAFSLTNCNTMEGMGKDIKKGGEKLEDSAAKHK